MTMIVLAESSGANPYAAQNAAVSASAGSHANSSYVDAERLQGGQRVGPARRDRGRRWDPRSGSSVRCRLAASLAATIDRDDRPLDDPAPTAPPTSTPTSPASTGIPEPALIGYRDPGASRAALRELGERTWSAALDFLYGIGLVERAMGDASAYPRIARRRYYGRTRRVPARDPEPLPANPCLGRRPRRVRATGSPPA